MELSKFVVALGIAFILTSFLNSALNNLYKPPKIDLSSCTPSFSNECADIISQKCGSPSYTDNTYFECSSKVYSSQEYKDCQTRSQNSYKNCIKEQTTGTQNYQIIYYIILAFLGILVIIVGFFNTKEESIGAGLIGGGILTVLFASLFAVLASFTSSLLSGYASLLSPSLLGLSPGITGAAISGVGADSSILPYINIVFNFIALLTLILFAHFKLEKEHSHSDHF